MQDRSNKTGWWRQRARQGHPVHAAPLMPARRLMGQALVWLAWPWAARAQTLRPAPPLPPLPKVKDSDGREIGLPANEQERAGGDGPIPNAALPLAPLPAAPDTAVDCGAYWYNDFGLEWTRLNQRKSWMGWYDWRWNWRSTNGFTGGNPSGQGYLPDRHPTLGWYRGDDRNTLSWQVKWLVEHGCGWAVLQQRTLLPDDDGQWNNPTSLAHWCWQLTMNMPAVNAGLFKLCFWLPHTAGPTLVQQGPSAAVWRDGQPTGKGRTVRDARDGKAYRAMRDGVTTAPGSNQADWEPAPTGQTATAGQWSPDISYSPGTSVLNPADQRLYRALKPSAGVPPDRQGIGEGKAWEPVPMPTAWAAFAAFYARHAAKIKTTRHNNKTYALVFMWEAEICRTVWGDATFSQWLQQLGQAMAAAHRGWDGVAVLMRSGPLPSTAAGKRGTGHIDYDQALAGSALLLRTGYPLSQHSRGAKPGPNGYQSLIDTFKVTTAEDGRTTGDDRYVHCVPTSLSTVRPHDSKFGYHGHSPEKFGAFVRKVRKAAEDGAGYVDANGRPTMLIYNVSEWAEAGPGLLPNQQDRFGYLGELLKAIT